MMDNDEEIDKRLIALGEIDKDRIMVAKAYNKKVGMEDHLATKEHRLEVREMVAKLGRSLDNHTCNI
jgi:hypothetical protein